MSAIKVYAGLSLDAGAVRSVLPEAEVCAPIARDDIVADAASGRAVVVIIDGRFHQSRAVACDEIMEAMRCGVVVFGAASMGALRAAELCRYGMRGCGEIFELIRGADVFEDDLIAQTFSEEDGTVTARSVAYVDLYFALVRLHRAGEIDRAAFDAIAGTVRDLHYTDRTIAGIRRALRDHGETVVALAERALRAESQKRIDAQGALAAVGRYLADVAALNQRLHARA